VTDSPRTGSTKTLGDAAIEKGIVFLLIFTPLAFGTVQHWSVAVMEIFAFSILFIQLLSKHAGKLYGDNAPAFGTPSYLKRGKGELLRCGLAGLPAYLLFPFSAFILLVLFQLLPLPEGLLRVVSPLSLATYKKFSSIAPGSLLPISVLPYATGQELLKLISYAAVFYVIVSHYRTKARVHALVKTILYIGICLALFAVVQKMTWNGRIFWFYPVEEYLRSGAGIWGPYINRNHFAGYMEMAIPLALGLLIYAAPNANTLPGVSFGRKVARFMASKNLVRFSVIFLSVLIMSASLFMTLSRGGIAGFGISFFFFVWITRRRRSLRSRALLLGLLAVVIAVVIVFAAWDQLEGRFEELEKESHISRLIVWNDSLGMVKDYPFFGSGLGTFENTYMRYQSRYPLALFDHAHNDYVELLTDTGIAGFVSVMSLAIIFFISVYRRWLRRRDIFAKCVGAGGLTSCIAIAVHSTTDFNLHIPANALLLTVIAALTYAAVFNEKEEKENEPASQQASKLINEPASQQASKLASEQPKSAPAGMLLPACQPASWYSRARLYPLVRVPAGQLFFLTLIYLILLYIPVRVLIADHYYARVAGILDDPETEGLDVRPLLPETLPSFLEAIRSLETARYFSPSRALYPKALSELYSRLGRWAEAMELLNAPLPKTAIPKNEAFEKAFYYLRKAVSLEPANADFHLALGHHYDTVLKDTARAEEEYQKAVAAFPVSVAVRSAVAARYLQSNRKGDALEQARMIAALDDSYILEDSPQKTYIIQRRTDDYMRMLYSSYLFRALDIAWGITNDPRVVSGITPNTPDAHEVLKAFMEWKGIEEKE